MAEQPSAMGSRIVIRLVGAGIALCCIVVLVLYFQEKRKERCDIAAHGDIIGLAVSLERFANELQDMGCMSKWKFEEKQLAFMVGPYYAWDGTNEKCEVKIRVENDEIWACSPKGSNQGEAGKKRLVYRFKSNGVEELTDTIEACYRQSYGRGACYTESIVIKDCSPKYRPMRNTTPEEQSACQSIKASLGAKLDEVSYIASSCINPFSIDMYGALIKNDDNFFFGPLTAYRQFFTMAEITRDETQREILKAIRLKKTTVKERSYIENLLKAVRCSVILGGGDYPYNVT